MKIFAWVFPLSVLLTCSALHLRQVTQPRVVYFEATRYVSPYPSSHRRRDALVSVSLYEDQYRIHYVINATAGTPPQSFRLTFDTGSADFIVRTSASPMCQAGNCTAYGSFDPTKSSSFSSIGIDFAQKYGEGTTANGTLATETISFGRVSLTNFTIGPANQSTVTTNVFGVGFPLEEAQSADPIPSTNSFMYPNALFKMRDEGLIQAAAYSMWLNDIDAPSGSVLFGGVDTTKYSGTLQSVPVVPILRAGKEIYPYLWISLDAIGTLKGSITTLTTASGFPITTLLDSGSTSCILPPQIVTNLCTEFGCTVQNGINYLPCNMQAPGSGNISFNFSGINITVPLREFVRPAPGLSSGMCYFDITSTTDPIGYILGDSFLRSAYVVYNIEAREIALAQTVFNVSSNNFLEITNASVSNPGYYNNFGIPGAANASNIRTGIPSATGMLEPAVTNGAVMRTVGGAAVAAAAAAFAVLVS